MQVGDHVAWNWGAGTGEGRITERFEKDVTRKIKGTDVKRTATPSEPAFLIRQADGDEVLKSVTELEPATQDGHY